MVTPVRAQWRSSSLSIEGTCALSVANVRHEFHQYDDAGHGFQDFVNPERYREERAKDAWAKIRVFFTEIFWLKIRLIATP